MPQSATRLALNLVVTARLANQGYTMQPGQMAVLISDIENVIIANQATVIADATADLLLFPTSIQGEY